MNPNPNFRPLSHKIVNLLAAAEKARSDFILTTAPEGSRRREKAFEKSLSASAALEDFIRELEGAAVERDALREFKLFVHRRLTEAGVPEEFPEGPHTAEGCRIGDRLDHLIGQRDAFLGALKEICAAHEVELNMRNYDEDQVAAVNEQSVRMCHIADEAIAKAEAK